MEGGELNIDFDLFPEENHINFITDLNRNINVSNDLIMYVNIRSLNDNLKNLGTTIETVKIKPILIVFVETWNIEPLNCYNLKGYKYYYNESRLNQNDGVVIYNRFS